MRPLFYFLFILFYTASVEAKPLPALIPYRDGDKWGYCDSEGIVKIKPQWDNADFFCGKKAVVTIYPENKSTNYAYYCLIDDKGNYIIPPSRHWNRAWNGWQTTMLNAHDSNNRYGLIDTNNNLLIPFKYDQETRYPTVLSQGYKVVYMNGRAGLINTENETFIPFIYDHIDDCPVIPGQQPVFRVTLNGRLGLVDLHGRELLAPVYSGIYPSNAYGYKLHAPIGFMLASTVLKNKKDSSKGYKDRYGWFYYPGGELITPAYNYFNYISDSFYIADGKLYTHNHKLALPATYNSFERRNDSLFARTTNRPKGRDSTKHDEYFFDIGNLQLLGKRTVVEKKFSFKDFMPQSQWVCGTGLQMKLEYEHLEAMRPALVIDGKEVKDFIRDTIHWYTDYSLAIDGSRVVLHGQGITQYTAWQAVANKQGKFLFPPFRTQGAVVALNLKDSLIILRMYDSKDGAHYSLCNLEGKILIAPQPRILSMPFRSPSGQILLSVGQPVPPPTFYIGQRSNFSYGPVFPGSACKLCDTSLKPMPALQNFYFHELADKRLSPSEDFQGYIKGTDTLGNWGYMSLEGDTLFKKISFQYKSLNSLTPWLFIVNNDKKNAVGLKLVNRKNEEVLADLSVRYVNDMQHERTNHDELFFPKDVREYRLVRVTYKIEGTDRDRIVYINEKGRIFAGKL